MVVVSSSSSHVIHFALVGLDVRDVLARRARDLLPIDEHETSLPWDERRRISLAIDDDDMFSAILDRAAAGFGVHENSDWHRGYGTDRFVALRDDDTPLSLEERLSPVLTLVDSDGRALWCRRFDQATYRDILVAASAGAVHGDPTQIYFHVRLVPAGGGVETYWSVVQQALDVAWRVLAVLAVANDAHDLYEKVKHRLRGRSTVSKRAEEWSRRNGSTHQLDLMFGGERWRPRDVAALLGCTTDEAVGLLDLYGYAPEPSTDSWYYAAGNPVLGIPTTDVAARVVDAYRREVIWKNGDADRVDAEELEALLRLILDQALRDGTIPLMDYEAALDNMKNPRFPQG